MNSWFLYCKHREEMPRIPFAEFGLHTRCEGAGPESLGPFVSIEKGPLGFIQVVLPQHFLPIARTCRSL
jgi:hypothetical protein